MIDYTKMRKGLVTVRTRSGKVIRKIDVCAKCGRKGERSELELGKVKFLQFDHIANDVSIAGIAFREIKDYCMIKLEQEPTLQT